MNRSPVISTSFAVMMVLIHSMTADRAHAGEVASRERGRNSSSVVTVRAEFFVEQTGRSGRLSVTAEIQSGYHIYAMSQAKPFLATEIHADPSDRFRLSGPFHASQPAKVLRHESIDVELHEHEKLVTWSGPIQLAPGADVRNLQITGHVNAQACNDRGCLPPKKYPFTARFNPRPPALNLTDGRDHSMDPLSVTPEQHLLSPSPSAVPSHHVITKFPPDSSHQPMTADLPRESRLDFNKLEAQGSAAANTPFYLMLPLAFVAGFLLNFMPCVLPVIGLKVMAFTQQAGDSRGRVLVLNLWYTLGLLSVFLVLATLAVFLGLGWGQQFSSAAFTIVLASVVCVFALSFLGVWEIPIPGFVGTGKASELAQREGIVGAFSKGVLTTILATPCSGPLLGSALTWALIQPPWVTYLVFTLVGLGMASPYLAVAVFPGLVSLLPKPGAWMNTFKHIMGFILLVTVVYLLTVIPIGYVIPTVAFMIGLGAACWWIGGVPVTENWDMKVRMWLQAGAFVFVVAFVVFGWLQGVMEHRIQQAIDRELARRSVERNNSGIVDKSSGAAIATIADGKRDSELPWQPYSRKLLERLISEGKTVLVDFTADWCLTCKSNETLALNTAQTKKFVAAHDIATLKADKTQSAPEADELLNLLGNKAGSIPFLAIFPATDPNKPILLDGVFTSPKPILDALRKATLSLPMTKRAAGGPSRRATAVKEGVRSSHVPKTTRSDEIQQSNGSRA